MTNTQKQALMALGSNGAVRVKGEWIWKEDIRNSEQKAEAVLASAFGGNNGQR